MINYSIIIPHYSSKDLTLLNRALKSIPQRDDIQIIVVDNSEIQHDFSVLHHCCLELYYSDNTKGAGHARNVGLNHITGRWVLFLDSDDFFNINSFDTLDKYVSSDYDVVYFKVSSSISDTGEKANRNIIYNELVDNYLQTDSDTCIRIGYRVPWGKMIRARFVKENKIEFDEVVAANDVMFSTKVGVFAHKIFADPVAVYNVTVSENSLIKTINIDTMLSRFNVNIRYNSFLKANGYRNFASVMYFIVQVYKINKLTALKMFFKALVTNNLFVGWQNWSSTYKKLNAHK